ncbi:MAG TPA: ATP-binding protein [Anaerolineae bacterium]|nr:ATP-binding protein [Anaerolineae bacterium]
MFIDRERELAMLEERYSSKQAEMFVLYGRRRVGKTELLRAFCQGKRHVFFVADLGSEALLLTAFSRTIGEYLLGPGVPLAFSTWDAAFEYLADAAQTERLVVVLDEFGYLAQANPAFPSILQRLWDTRLKDTRIFLVLCGSYVSLMEREVLAYRAPLYGRRTGQYLLMPLDFPEATLFFPGYSPDDLVTTYAVLGGTPAYLRQFDDRCPLLENIRDRILTPQTYLYDEPRFLLLQEVREPRSYFAILEAMARGNTRPNEIAQAAGLGGGATAMPYLKMLMELRLVERRVPATTRHPHKSRKGLYRLSDPFFRFWFRFVYPHRSALEEGRIAQVLEQHIAPRLDEFTADVFEEICRRHTWRLELPFIPERVGAWWSARGEVDVVAISDEARAVLVGECKWSAKPVGTNIFDELRRKAQLLQREGFWERVYYALFSRAGFTKALQETVVQEEVILISPQDLSAL